jgi:hypothetical protein
MKTKELHGLSRAKRNTKCCKDVVDEDIEYEIYQLRSKGKSIRAIAKSVGISVGRTHQVCSSMSL